jgi:hypothetical protein
MKFVKDQIIRFYMDGYREISFDFRFIKEVNGGYEMELLSAFYPFAGEIIENEARNKFKAVKSDTSINPMIFMITKK